ncbi:MAG: universal stress protein [Phycisphaeraceae bacterium]|nr:universal stress protein [Phycisphaeraceae bacterium]
MNALKHIVVGLDFTPASRAALKQAVRIASWNEATLHAVHVVDHTWFQDLAAAMGLDSGRLAADVETRGRELAAAVAAEDHPGVTIRTSVAAGAPVDMLTRTLKTDNADLLVLGVRSPVSQGKGPGPVAQGCLRSSRGKVLLAREDHSGPYKTIIACTDFSETSLSALQMAVRVAQQDKAVLRVVHAAIPPRLDMAFAGHPLGMWPGEPTRIMEMWNTYRSSLGPRLEAFAARLASETTGLTMHLDIIEHEHYGRGVAEYAREQKADLLVLGTQGRTNMRYALLGSTAERILDEFPCSVLAVKPAEFERDLP